MLPAMLLTAGRKLELLQASDPYKQLWWLDEVRFCAKCEHPFQGTNLKVYEDDAGRVHFRCPSFRCESGWEDWEYPQLHL